MDAQGQDMTPQLLQRLLSRLDFIEYRLIRDNQSDTVEQVERLRTDMTKFREAARLEAADRALADAWAVAPRYAHVGHRGPGAEPMRPAPARAPAPAAPAPEPEAPVVTADLAEGAPLYKEDPEPPSLPPPKSPDDEAAQSLKRRASPFSKFNSLVKTSPSGQSGAEGPEAREEQRLQAPLPPSAFQSPPMNMK